LHVADSVRIDRDEADTEKGGGKRPGSKSSTAEEQGQAADSGPVREPSGAGQSTTQGDEAES
jgi:hypothetical protein